ncbi:MAG: glycosyltransferase family 2 protein [Acidobacteria bacterium]|nr:glycosyltransferase family 2 protein [Acidobacteriota bacterium]
MLEQITPLVLTYNEAPNIGRTLERLSWARDIVVVDSFSSDETLEIVSRFPQARVFQRKFDSHEAQWNFALNETGVSTEWVLALDADYMLTPASVEELRSLKPGADVNGYSAKFTYCIEGRPLRGSAYPPVTVLYRRAKAFYRQDGHTQRIVVDGSVGELSVPIMHDDRKPLAHWLQAQARYMRLEAGELTGAEAGSLGWSDRLRQMRFVAPFVMLLYCLFVKRAILDGRVGLFYAFQRTVAEFILSLFLIEHDLRRVVSEKSEETAGKVLPADLVKEAEEQGLRR